MVMYVYRDSSYRRVSLPSDPLGTTHSSHPHRFGVSLNVTFAERGHTARLEHHPPDVILSPWGTRVSARPSAFGPQVPPLV